MIIDRYIMREIIKPTVAVCSILVFIFGCYMATHFLVDALSGQLPGTTVIILILLRIAIALEVLLPTTLYLCVVVALGRLYKDSEMTALFCLWGEYGPDFPTGFVHGSGDCGGGCQFIAFYSALGLPSVLSNKGKCRGKF